MVRATGLAYAMEFVHVVTVRDGRIARFRESFDTWTAAQAFLGEATGSALDLNHLYLRVRDVEASLAFYRDLFDFHGAPEWQGETLVVRNGAGFALALTPDPAPPAWPDGLHFGFVLGEVAHARRIRDRVAAAGVPFLEAYEEPAFLVFKVRDPDGHIVEVESGVPVNPPPA